MITFGIPIGNFPPRFQVRKGAKMSKSSTWPRHIFSILKYFGPDPRRYKADHICQTLSDFCYNLLSSRIPSTPFIFSPLLPSFSSARASSSSQIFNWPAFHQTPTSKRVETAMQAEVVPHMK